MSGAAAGALAIGSLGCRGPSRGASPPTAPSNPAHPSAARAVPETGLHRKAERPYPVLDVAGSHRAIGRAVGESFRSVIQEATASQPAWDACLKSARGPGQARVRAFEAAVRQAYPHLVEELEGMAEGCAVPWPDLFAWNCRSELDAAADPCPPGCSTVGWVGEAQMLLVHNEDGAQAYEGKMFVLRARPPSGISFAVLVYPGTWPGNGPGFNARDVVQTTNYIGPCAVSPGIPRYAIGRAVLEAPSLEAAVSTATSPGRSFPWHHNLASLAKGTLVSLETWPGRHHRRDVSGLHLHTNHLLHPEMLDLPERKAYLARSSKPRLEALRRRLTGATKGERAALEAALRDRSGTPCKVCRRPGDEVPGVTVATATFEAPHQRMVLRGGDLCDGPAQPIALMG